MIEGEVARAFRNISRAREEKKKHHKRYQYLWSFDGSTKLTPLSHALQALAGIVLPHLRVVLP